MPYYLHPINEGLKIAASNSDGYSINLKWNRAFPTKRDNKIAYNIYINTELFPFESKYFDFTPSFVSTNGSLTVDILDLTPGQMYWFSVRAAEYDQNFFDLKTLPTVFNGLNVYPESLLRDDITETSIVIPLIDTSEFPDAGVVRVGVELIQYTSKNDLTNDLILTNPALQRGYNDTTVTFHNTNGYDGYETWDPTVLFFPVVSEEKNTVVFECQNRFDYPNYSFTVADGYKQQTKDILTTDLTASDAANENFPSYDYAGWHRTDPVALLNGDCVGSYIGGEQYCADGYDGVGRVMRGMSVQDQNNQRQEVLLSMTGEPVVLVKMQRTGIRCHCFLPSAEYPDARCDRCYGTGFVVGWIQYFNERRSDGRILVRFDPTSEDLKLTDSGLDPDFLPSCWTLVVPTLKDRDFIVRFDQDGNEEFRYEVLNVTRNKLLDGLSGAQKFSLQRIRKTDTIYQVKVFRDTSEFPSTVTTTMASSLGIPPHTHTIRISEKILSVGQINQITSISAGHSHTVQNGVVLDEGLGHTHLIII